MKILIVEDDVFFQNFYATKLKEQNFEIIVAKNGNEGIDMMRQQQPNLVLLDLIMPEKDGFEVLQTISQDPQLKLIPVLVFSTLGAEADIKKALSLGARDFIGKTFYDFDNLLKKILTYLPSSQTKPI